MPESMAFDLTPWPVNWQNIEEFCVLAGWVLAVAALLLRLGIISHEVRWGGDWDRDYDTDDERFRDYGHFELVEAS